MRKTIEDSIYASLEREMLDYPDYAHIPIEDNGEPLVEIPEMDHLQTHNIAEYMRPITGDRIYVREGVLNGLIHAATNLGAMDSRMKLQVVCGYRDLGIQRQRFETRKAEIQEKTGLTGEDLMTATHRIIAVPEAAGHPAGAAVDLQIIDGSDRPLDFGTPIWAFKRESYSRAPVSKKARINRELLRAVMTEPAPGKETAFAPYDGEWWHFCDGDIEHARYYDLAAARYGQVEFPNNGLHLAPVL